MKKGKVQTNDKNINVLVEHEDSTNTHFSHLDVPVLCEKLSDVEIVNEFNKLTLTKKEMVQILQTKKGFAVSNVHSKNGDFTTGDLFRYKALGKMKTVKTNSHLLLVDESAKIDENDWFYDELSDEKIYKRHNSHVYPLPESCVKILAATPKIEGLPEVETLFFSENETI